jgi:hypothetical protein
VMAESFGDPHSPGSGKRPAPTIEGTATEVSVDPTAGETASPAPAIEAGKSGPGGPKAKHGARGAPPRTSSTELKSFLTHLAAGLLGGLVGVVTLALAWNKLPVRIAAPPDLSPLERRLTKLETAPPPVGDAEALSQFDARLKALEERKVETPPDLSSLAGRVTRLEGSLNSLAETAKDAGSVADAAALDTKIGDVEQKLQGKIDAVLTAQQALNTKAVEALQGEVAALKAKLGALAEANLAGDSSDLAPQLTTVDQRIARLEAALPNLSTAIDRSAAGAKSGAAAIAFANLCDAANAGRPYAAELAVFQSFLPGSDLGALASHAETGIPTIAELARSLDKVAEASAAPPPAAPSEASFLESMIASAKSAVSIRRIGADTAGTEPSAALTKAEAALAQGDLAAAIKEVEAMPAPSRDAFTAWLDDARARATANDTLTKLENTVLAFLGGGTGSGAKP